MPTSRAYSDPDVLAQVTGLALRARQVVEGYLSGLHRSPFLGFNVEFAEYREYSPGDDLRRLDWRAYARSDRFYIKENEAESNLRATLVVDASASMRYRSGAMSKYDYAATLAATLSLLLIQQRDPVGLTLVADRDLASLPAAATRAQFERIVGVLETHVPIGETDLASALGRIAEQSRRRGMIIVLSDLLTDLDPFVDGLSRLRYKGHEIIVFQIMDRDELELPFEDPILFHDLEGDEELQAEPWAFRSAYQKAMRRFRTEIHDACAHRGVDHRFLLTNEELGTALSHYLHARGAARGSA